MTPALLLQEIRHRGVTVHLQGDYLRVQAPARSLTPELRQSLRVMKGELVQLLRQERSEPAAHVCAQCSRIQFLLAGRRPRCFVCEGPYLPLGAGGEDQ